MKVIKLDIENLYLNLRGIDSTKLAFKLKELLKDRYEVLLHYSCADGCIYFEHLPDEEIEKIIELVNECIAEDDDDCEVPGYPDLTAISILDSYGHDLVVIRKKQD